MAQFYIHIQIWLCDKVWQTYNEKHNTSLTWLNFSSVISMWEKKNQRGGRQAKRKSKMTYSVAQQIEEEVAGHICQRLKNPIYCSVELIISWLRTWLPACCFLFVQTTLSWASCDSERCLWSRQLVDLLQHNQTDLHNKQVTTINEPINDLSSRSLVQSWAVIKGQIRNSES